MPSIFWEESLMMLVVQLYSALAFLKKCNCGNSLRVSLPVKRQKTCIKWIFCTQHMSIISIYIITFFRKALCMSYPTSFFKSWRWTLIDFFDLLVDIDGINESSSTNQLTKFCGSSYLIYYLLIIIQDTKKNSINTIRFLNFGY